MRSLLLITCVFTLTFASYTMASDEYLVLDFEHHGVDKETAISASHVFRLELIKSVSEKVVPRAETEKLISSLVDMDVGCRTVDCLVELGKKLNVRYVVSGNLTRLGERITADAFLVDISKGTVVFDDSFQVESINDLNALLGRMAKAIGTREHTSSEIGRFHVTTEETEDPRRKKSYTTTGLMIEMGYPSGNSYMGVDMIGAALVIRREAGSFIIETSIGGMGGEDVTVTEDDSTPYEVKSSVGFFDLSLQYILNYQADFTPYIGGGAGIHSTNVTMRDFRHEMTFAPALHLSGGVILFQSYNTRLIIGAKYSINVVAIKNKEFILSDSPQKMLRLFFGITKRGLF